MDWLLDSCRQDTGKLHNGFSRLGAYCKVLLVERNVWYCYAAVCIRGRVSPFLYATKALRVSRGVTLLFLGPLHSRWRWGGVSPIPRPPLSPWKAQYPLYGGLGRPQGRSGRSENLVHTGIRSRTVCIRSGEKYQRILCITLTVEHNYILRSSTVRK